MASSSCITGHSVDIHVRGGRQRVASLTTMSRVQWGRARDSKSQSVVEIAAENCAANERALDLLEPNFHEVVVFRGDDRVWEGPIRDIRWGPDGVRLISDDVKAYIDETPCSIAWPGPDDGGDRYMTERIRQIIEYELTTPYVMDVGLTSPDVRTVQRWETVVPPANMLPYLDVRASTGTGGILTTASVEAFQMTVGEHLDNLARGGLDFTTVGRSLVIWDSARELGRLQPLTEANFTGRVYVYAAGREFAAIGHVVAQGGQDDDGVDLPPAVGNAGGTHDYYGPWTRILTREDEEGSDTPSQEELNSQARRVIAGRSPVPVQVQAEGNFLLSPGMDINDLVPGVVAPIRATLSARRVAQDQVIDSVTVDESATGESISVSFVPVGPVSSL